MNRLDRSSKTLWSGPLAALMSNPRSGASYRSRIEAPPSIGTRMNAREPGELGLPGVLVRAELLDGLSTAEQRAIRNGCKASFLVCCLVLYCDYDVMCFALPCFHRSLNCAVAMAANRANDSSCEDSD